MFVKGIVKKGLNGNIDLQACLYKVPAVDENRFSDENLICDLGSMNNGGLTRLIELSNSIHAFLLNNVIDSKRDGLVSSRSFGVYYLINHLLERWEQRKPIPTLFDLETETSVSAQFLPSLIAAVTDTETISSSSIESLNRKYHAPLGVEFEAERIQDILNSFENNDFQYNLPELEVQKNQLMFGIMPSKQVCDSQKNEISFHDQKSCCSFSEKLTSWITHETGIWNDIQNINGLFRFVTLADHVRAFSEENSGTSWERIVENLSTIHAIRFERDSKTLLLITRPNSRQLSLFYRLGIDPPPMVICEQDLSASVRIDDTDELEPLRQKAYELVI